jgi:hypothetical protein
MKLERRLRPSCICPFEVDEDMAVDAGAAEAGTETLMEEIETGTLREATGTLTSRAVIVAGISQLVIPVDVVAQTWTLRVVTKTMA